jgi:hypothetical protein
MNGRPGFGFVLALGSIAVGDGCRGAIDGKLGFYLCWLWNPWRFRSDGSGWRGLGPELEPGRVVAWSPRLGPPSAMPRVGGNGGGLLSQCALGWAPWLLAAQLGASNRAGI